MKKTKILLTLVCAVLLVAASVMGTLAYLKAETKAVVNTFTVGNVKFNTKLNNGLDEAKVDTEGNLVEKADRVTENVYKLLPGHTYTKDPTVHLSDESEKCYLFVTVDNKIEQIEAENGNKIADQMKKLGWKEVKDGEDKLVAWVYCGTTTTESVTTTNSTRKILDPKTVETDRNIVVFEEFTVSNTLDGKALAAYATTDADGKDTGVKITVKAYAIQADGLKNETDYNLWLKASTSTGTTTE